MKNGGTRWNGPPEPACYTARKAPPTRAPECVQLLDDLGRDGIPERFAHGMRSYRRTCCLPIVRSTTQ